MTKTCLFFASQILLNVNVFVLASVVKMADEKLHFLRIILYEFRNGVSIRTAIKKLYF